MREANFAREMKASFESFGHFYLKIPDAIPAVGDDDKNGPRFIPPKPFDAIAVWRGVSIAMEYKQHKSDTQGFRFDRLLAHQKENLLAHTDSGGLSFVIINVRVPRRINRAHIIPIKRWIELESYSSDRKSLPAEHLKRIESLPWIKRGGKYIWDIESYLIKLKYYRLAGGSIFSKTDDF